MSRSDGGAAGHGAHLAPPPPEVMAAIVAAVEVAWPRPVVLAPAAGAAPGQAWKWSGRWWGSRHVAAERRRPWS